MKEPRAALMRFLLLVLVLVHGFYALGLLVLAARTASRSTVVASLPLSMGALMVVGAVSTLFYRGRLSRGASR